jgi:hypothetical protein
LAGPTFWNQKPWWCQPWSILLTGTVALLLDGLAFLRLSVPLWLALPFALLVLAWWFLFLRLVPLAYQLESDQQAGQKLIQEVQGKQKSSL